MNLLHNNPTITKRPSSYVYENPDLGTYSRIVYVNTQSVNIQDIEGLSDSAKIFHLSASHKIERAYRSCIERASLMAKDEVATVTPESATVVVISDIRKMADYCLSRVKVLRGMAEEGVFAIVPKSANVFPAKISHLSASDTMERAYHRRIKDLRGMAKDEGFMVAQESVNDFWQLIRSLLPTRKAQLVLTDEGNLIAIWDDDDGNYVDIEFLGAGSLHYLIFKGPEHSPNRICEEGGGDIQTVKRQAQKHNLAKLLGYE